MRFYSLIALTSASICMTSCESWRFSKPVDDITIRTPATWAAAAQGTEGKITTAWLSEFHEPELTQTVNQALAHNHDLKVAAARMREAQESSIISRSRLLPSLGIGSNASTTDLQESATRRNYGLSLAASWEVDLWGRLRNLAQAARAEERAAREDYRGARLSLAATTAKAWCNLITAEQELQLAQIILESFEKNLRIIERNYIGTGEGALDIKFGRNNVSSAKRNLETRKLDLTEAARSLEVLLGRYPSGDSRNPRELPKLETWVPSGLPADLIDRRPDLAAARARLFASAQSADAARKALLPAISLTGNSGTSSANLSQLLDLDSLVNTLTARFSQVLTEGGAVSANARAALARNQANLERYAQTALLAFREVESALAADRSLAIQEKFLISELEQAALAEKQSERDYSEGVNPNILSVLEAQRRANNARASMIRLGNQRLQNRIDLHLALGGDFATPP